jgi:hypothetical protein
MAQGVQEFDHPDGDLQDSIPVCSHTLINWSDNSLPYATAGLKSILINRKPVITGGQIMNTNLRILTIVFAMAAACAANISLSGKVVDISGNPLADVDVSMVSQTKVTTTNAAGEYTLTGMLSSIDLFHGISRPDIAVLNNKVRFVVDRSGTPVTISLYTCAGRRVGINFSEILDRGTYIVDLFSNPRVSIPAQLYHLVVTRGSAVTTCRFTLGSSLSRCVPLSVFLLQTDCDRRS